MDTNAQRLVHTFSALADLGQEITDAASFEEMLDTSFHVLLGTLAIRRGAVAEYDSNQRLLRFVVERGLEGAAQESNISDEEAARLAEIGVSGLTQNDAGRENLTFT